jgi:hypothetical protein
MRLHLKLKRQGEKCATGSDIKNVRFAKPPRPPHRIMATNARRAILRETDNLSVAQIRPVACFYDSIWGARGWRKTDILYVGPCRARCAVLGVLLVGCKIFPSGVSLERPTRQKPTEPTTKLVAILQRLLVLPLEILVERALRRKQQKMAINRTESTNRTERTNRTEPTNRTE